MFSSRINALRSTGRPATVKFHLFTSTHLRNWAALATLALALTTYGNVETEEGITDQLETEPPPTSSAVRKQAIGHFEMGLLGAWVYVPPARTPMADNLLFVVPTEIGLRVLGGSGYHLDRIATVSPSGHIKYADDVRANLPASPQHWPYRDAAGKLKMSRGKSLVRTTLYQSWDPAPPPNTVAWYFSRKDGVLVRGHDEAEPFPNIVWVTKGATINFLGSGPIYCDKIATIESDGHVTTFDTALSDARERFRCESLVPPAESTRHFPLHEELLIPFCDALLPLPPPPSCIQ
jgi:hypothetical protein